MAPTSRLSHGRVLITGSGGFIGKHLSRRLRLDVDLHEITNSADCDLRDLECTTRRLRRARPDVIIHLAATSDAGGECVDGSRLHLNTLLATQNILRGLADAGCLIVHVGSYKQYGRAAPPFDESARQEPTTVYGWSKCLSERAVVQRSVMAMCRMVCLRLGSVYGPGQSRKRLVPFLVRALESSYPWSLRLADTYWDPIYVDDAIEAIVAAAAQSQAAGHIINVSGGRGVRLCEVAAMVGSCIGIEPSVVQSRVQVLTGAPRSCVGAIKKASQILGWEPRTTLAEGLRVTAAQLTGSARRWREPGPPEAEFAHEA